jgi:dolichol-phosphate mannosyltransferase
LRNDVWGTLRLLSGRYFRFCLVGCSGVLIDVGLLWLLRTKLEWQVPAAKLSASEVALLNNFLWNELWTFREKTVSPGSIFMRLLRFHLICLTGIGLSLLLLLIFTNHFAWPVWSANLTAVLLVSVWNFTLNWNWGWQRTKVR